MVTNCANVLAVPTGSAPCVVGLSVSPKAETMMLIPAVAYSAFFAARTSGASAAKAPAWSRAPLRVRKERATTLKPYKEYVLGASNNTCSSGCSP